MEIAFTLLYLVFLFFVIRYAVTILNRFYQRKHPDVQNKYNATKIAAVIAFGFPVAMIAIGVIYTLVIAK